MAGERRTTLVKVIRVEGGKIVGKDPAPQVKIFESRVANAYNPLLMELYADTTGCTVVAPPEDTDAVLLGTAIVAAAAAGVHPDLGAAARAMAQPGTTRRPETARREAYDRRYRAFLEMHEHRRALDRLLGARA